MTTFTQKTFIISALATLAACETTTKPVVQETPTQAPSTKEVITFSSTPILNPSKQEVIYAQTALKSLGYSVGGVDGIWGKRSSSAIQSFETNQHLVSANGYLSRLNIKALQESYGAALESVKLPSRKTQKAPTIASKLKSATPNKAAPELIIVEQQYTLMSKANPYSHTLGNIEPGAAIYILSIQNGWYEVETSSKKYGFIQEK